MADQEYIGIMIAFYLPPEMAGQLAIPGGEAPSELHLTLAYLGDITQAEPSTRLLIEKTVADFAAHQTPIGGEVSGVGLFNTAEEGETNAFYASFDSPRLARFRAALVDQLHWAGVDVVSNHGFTPHITLAYLPKGQPLPVVQPPALPVVFSNVCFCWGGERSEYLLAGLELEVKGTVRQTMHEFRHGELHSGSKKGPLVRNRKQAIAIALSQAASRSKKKELTEKANYHAHAGETIAGNLTRGANGKFTSGGGGSAKPVDVAQALERGNKIIDSRLPKDKPYKTLPPAKGGKGGKGGKKGGKGGAKPKPTAEEKKAEADKNRTEVLSKVLGDDLTEALTVGDTPGDLAGVKPEYGDKLVEAGLAKKLNDGSYVTTLAARSMLRAAEKGDLAAAQRIAQEAQSQASTTAQKKPTGAGGSSAKITSGLARAVAASKPAAGAKPKAEPKPKAPKAGGGGKGAAATKPAKPTPDQKVLAQRQKRDATLSKILQPELVDAMAAFADDPTAELDPKAAEKLTAMGILQRDTMGNLRMSGTAHMLLNAATRGDERAVRDALSRAQDQANLKAELDRKRAEAEAKRKRPPSEQAVSSRDAPASIGKGHKPKETARQDGGLFIYKQADGRYRWITFSSSAFEDRDEEIVSLKALQMDVARADLDGDYGPLLWWHVPELVLGQCDYNTMIGRILVESGTFKSARIAEAIMRIGDKLGASIGFFPSMVGKVYKAIRRKERSLLPEPVASNILTKLFVRKNKMAKLDILKQLFGGGQAADELVNEIVQEATTKEQQALDMGLVHKAAQKLNTDGSGDTTDGVEPPVMKDDLTPVAEGGEPLPEEGDMTMEEGEPGEELPGEADLDAIVEALHDKLASLILSTIQSALEPIGQTLSSVPTTKETNLLGLTLKEVVGILGKQNEKIAALEKQVTELTADVPPVVAGMMRASQSAATVNKDEEVVKQFQGQDPEVNPYRLAFGGMVGSFAARPFAAGAGTLNGQQ